MSDTVIVALVSAVSVVVSALVTAFISKDRFSTELDKKIAVITNEIGNIKGDIQDLTAEVKKHNDFAVKIPLLDLRLKHIEGEHHG